MLKKRLAAALMIMSTLPWAATSAQTPPGAVIPGPLAPPAVKAVAILGTLDKITAKVTRIEVQQDQPYRLGTLKIILRTCRTNPPEDAPETAAFLEISESKNQQSGSLFTGWMFASSPSLSALDHPVYDVWVISCNIVAGVEALPSD